MMNQTALDQMRHTLSRRKAGNLLFVLLLCLLGAGAPANGAEMTVVSPSANAGFEGDINIDNTGGPGHVQYLFPASDFASLPESHRHIVKWNHRADASQASPVDWTFGDYRIWMSTTDKASLSGDFVGDSGADRSLVFEGAYTYSLLASGPAEGPRDFGDSTRLQTPFYYDPSLGNLLVEVTSPSNSTPFPGPHLDFATTAENRVAFPNNPSAAAAVSQFTFVPEPTTIALLSVALVAVGGMARRQSR